MNRISLTLASVVVLLLVPSLRAEPLPGTKPLTAEGDLSAPMVAGIDKYLMREIGASIEKRQRFWKVDRSSREAYDRSVQPNCERLKTILGVVDSRVPFNSLEYVSTIGPSSLLAENDRYQVYAVRWPVLPGLQGEGLLLEPKIKARRSVVALPDADWSPEMLVGLKGGLPEESLYPRYLAEHSCRVLVPVLIDRRDTWSGSERLNRWTNQPHREFLYRMSYQMGRHLLGYEVQKVLAAVDWLTRHSGDTPVAVAGYGEGGLIALLASAIDPRITITVASGCFGPWENLWDQPIYRNVWGLLREFGAAEVAALQSPHGRLLIEASTWPSVQGPPVPREGRRGAAPGRLVTPEYGQVEKEFQRLEKLGFASHRSLIKGPGIQSGAWVAAVLGEGKPVELHRVPLTIYAQDLNLDARLKRQFDQLVSFLQKLMHDSEARRAETFWAKIDISSREKFEKSTEPFRKQLWEEVLGKLPAPTVEMNPRTREIYDTPKWKAYEVTLDLYPDVFAYGILCVPKDLKAAEKRPVVVCQHGLEGKPTDVVNPKERTKFYNSFGSALADRGYIVYAPQNPYIGRDNFRVLQRKANPLGLSLFSFIIGQHERTLDWLASLPFVDPERMAFYGLSYGGKTAMRVPAVLPRYCLSICSGDFNEWTWKNISVDFRGSYMFTIEYEMPEFNMGHTLVYAEMAALIAPRPFMVERGHDDPVGIDEWVAYEYAKVRRLYSRLKLPERTTIEFFAGGHEINGKETFAFLQKHLQFPK